MEAILGLPLPLTVLQKGVKRSNKSYILFMGLLSQANPHIYLIALAIPYSRNLKVRYDIGFSLAAFTKINVCFVTPVWVATTLKIACIGYSVLVEHIGSM